ncbi:hypothetical protein GCM10018952_37370 [Streptosporangium vulgare]
MAPPTGLSPFFHLRRREARTTAFDAGFLMSGELPAGAAGRHNGTVEAPRALRSLRPASCLRPGFPAPAGFPGPAHFFRLRFGPPGS